MGRRQWTFWIIGWLWVLEEWQTAVVFWPEVSYQPVWRVGHRLLWQGQRVLIVLSVALVLKHAKQGGDASCVSHTPILFGIGCQYWGREEPWVEVKCDEGGSHQAALCGHFTIQVSGDHPFRAWTLMLFLGLLDAPDRSRGSRRTRDGCTP